MMFWLASLHEEYLYQTFCPTRWGGQHFVLFKKNDAGEFDEAAFAQTIKTFQPDVAIISNQPLGHLRRFLPRSCKTILDVMDIHHLRSKVFESKGWEHYNALSEKDEFDDMLSYDACTFIGLEDLEYTHNKHPQLRCIYTPHTVEPIPLPLQDNNTCGIMASPAKTSVEGLDWLHETYSAQATNMPRLLVAGTIARVPNIRDTFPCFEFAPFVLDSKGFYQALSIAINPIRYPGGMKIKTIETLAYGVPLVATSDAISGIPAVPYQYCLRADDSESFCKSIQTLAQSKDLRKELHDGALRLVQEHLVPQKGLSALEEYIQH